MQMNLYEQKSLEAALILWYPFRKDARALLIVEDDQTYKKLLKRRICELVTVSGEQLYKGFSETFDYVLCMSLPEAEKDPALFLKQCRACLKPDGILLFPMHNRLGIRYFCGDRDPYTEHVLDGIENYVRAELSEENPGRMYARSEMDRMLAGAGFERKKYYSVLSGLEYPMHLAAENYVPNEDLANRILPVYHYPLTVFMEEERLYQALIDNGMFHAMANAYLVECGNADSILSDALYVTSSIERGEGNSLFTILYEDHVSKIPIYPEGRTRLLRMNEYANALNQCGIQTLEMKLEYDGRSENDPDYAPSALSMPYVREPVAQKYLLGLLAMDREAFLTAMDLFMEEIDRSVKIIREDNEYGPIAEKIFIDMIPLNSFYIEERYVFFDQEFVLYEYPINVLKTRALTTFFAYHDENRYIEEELYQRYGLLEKREQYQKMEAEFLSGLWQDDIYDEYRSFIRRDTPLTLKNRQWINHPEGQYRKLFDDIFDGADRKKCYLFGAGKYAESFIDLYGMLYPVEAIFDNNHKRWGDMIRGIPVWSPDRILSLPQDQIKIFICMRDYDSVIKQLDAYHVRDYSIYDKNRSYPRDIHIEDRSEKAEEKKTYHIGYISGTFDLFHKGHLNLLRQAKEQCDYLIVGVVSDEGVRKFKHTEAVIPFAERKEIVASCRYVDKAVEIPLYHRDIRNAYELYHFDCQFCGSDYYNDPVFMTDREWLRERGSNLEVLPYTESTSSTQIKAMIEKSLL